MNKKILKLIEKIFENEELMNKVVKAETFDELYYIIKLKNDLKISKMELKEFMDKYSNFNQDDLKELKNLSEAELNSVAGGANGFRNKAIASALSFLTMAQVGAGIVSAKENPNEVSSNVVKASTLNKFSQISSKGSKNLSSKQKTGIILGTTASVAGVALIATGLVLKSRQYHQLAEVSKGIAIKRGLESFPLDKLLDTLPDNSWKWGNEVESDEVDSSVPKEFPDLVYTELLKRVRQGFSNYFYYLNGRPIKGGTIANAAINAVKIAAGENIYNIIIKDDKIINTDSAYEKNGIVYNAIVNDFKNKKSIATENEEAILVGSKRYFKNLIKVLDDQAEALRIEMGRKYRQSDYGIVKEKYNAFLDSSLNSKKQPSFEDKLDILKDVLVIFSTYVHVISLYDSSVYKNWWPINDDGNMRNTMVRNVINKVLTAISNDSLSKQNLELSNDEENYTTTIWEHAHLGMMVFENERDKYSNPQDKFSEKFVEGINLLKQKPTIDKINEFINFVKEQIQKMDEMLKQVPELQNNESSPSSSTSSSFRGDATQ